MGSQFVDFNADGHIDYITATFDGSPHVAYGSKDGFTAPVRLKDTQGRRLLISSIWNYEARKHEQVGHAMPDGTPKRLRCISALAFDWDADGDYDLLLGSYEEGRLYRQMNEGTNQEPKFSGKNIPVMAGGKEWAMPAKMTAPQLIDWDGDGDLDIVVGTFGDTFNMQGKTGGIYLARNNGKNGAPSFAAFETLIAPQPRSGDELKRPDSGLYPHACDYDGDGDLDLLVGGYSLWMPVARELSEDEQAEATRLKAQQKDAQKRYSEVMRAYTTELSAKTKGMQRGSDEWLAVQKKVYAGHKEPMGAMRMEMMKVQQQLAKLIPSQQRKAYVWLFERE
ncbi:MAG: VCBS repeat-containing protein [Planctomycetota bacterium]